MDKYLGLYFIFLFFAGKAGIYAQIDDISFDHRTDDLSSYLVIFEGYYHSGAVNKIYFTEEDTKHYSFAWDFGDGNSGYMPATMHRYSNPGTYEVTLTVTSVSDPLTVYFERADVTVDNVFEVPNVFTPDGDGINDVFLVRSNGVIPLTMTIFDRGGTIVYKNTSPVINWDGRTPGGSRVRPGVYFYVIASSDPFYNRTGFIHVYYNR